MTPLKSFLKATNFGFKIPAGAGITVIGGDRIPIYPSDFDWMPFNEIPFNADPDGCDLPPTEWHNIDE